MEEYFENDAIIQLEKEYNKKKIRGDRIRIRR